MENEIEEFYEEYIGLELDIEEYRKTDRLSKVLVVFASVMLSIGITYLLSYYNIIADGIEDIGIAGFRGPLVASVSSLLVFAAIFLMAIALRLRLRNVRSDIDKYVVVRYELCKSIRDYKNNDFEEVVRHLKTYQKKLTVGPHYLPSFLLVISFEKFANLIYIRRLKQSEDLKKSLHGTFEGFLMANIQLIENKIADDIFDAAYQIEIKEQESSSYLAIFLSALSDLRGINARIITVGWILLAAGVGITINSFFGGSLAIAAVTIILGIPQLYQATSTISNRT